MYKDRARKKDLFVMSLTKYLRLKIENPYEYLKEKSRRNRLFFHDISDRNVPLSYLEKLEPIIKALNEVYDDNWDFLFYYKLVNNKIRVFFNGFITRFPQVTIENEKGQKYEGIKDLFVLYKMSITSGVPFCVDISGGRTTMSFEEYYSYGHSHYDNLPYSNYEGRTNEVLPSVFFSKFCLGTSDLSTYILESTEPDNNNENYWTKFFVQMFTIVYYESLSGMPYHKFSSIRLPAINSNYSRASFNTPMSDSDFLKLIFKNYKNQDARLNMSLFDNKLDVDFGEDFEKYVLETLDNRLTNYKKHYLCYKIEGNSYELSVNNTFNVQFKRYLPSESLDIIPLVYRQKEYPLVITDIPNEGDTVTPQLMLMSETKDYIRRCLKRRISKIQKNETFKSISKNKTSSNRRGLQRNNIPLQENK